MEYKNYWGSTGEIMNDLQYTDCVKKILDEQCKYLSSQTNGAVFAVFGEIKLDGSMIIATKALAAAFRNISGLPTINESIGELSTGNHIDASSMYFNKRYGFEICTEKYRFRLFELKMTPVFPIEMIVDEDICKNIGRKLSQIAIRLEETNHFEISDETVFCETLEQVLQDKKVRYIVSELNKRVISQKKMGDIPKKVIICEGRTDEIILQAIAQKLNQMITIVVAEGKSNLPVVFDTISGKNDQTEILVVADSDGDEEYTRKSILSEIQNEKCQMAVINNRIEDWFEPEVADYSKLKLMQSIDAIIDKTDFDDLCRRHESFSIVKGFLEM